MHYRLQSLGPLSQMIIGGYLPSYSEAGSRIGSQCTAPTRKLRNLGLFQLAQWHVKANVPVTGKGRAKGAFSANRFFIKIVPVVASSGN